MSNWFSRLREKVEKMVFAGLKPDAPLPGAAKKSKLESLMASAEDLASRGLQPDEKPLSGPVTWRQKAGITIGLLATGGFIFFLVTVLQHPAERGESKAPPPPLQQILAPGVKIDKNKDLEVVHMEFHRDTEPKSITGTLRNRTDKTFATCEVSFNIATREGTELGGASATIHDLGPHAETEFHIPVPQKNAGFVLVRELRTD